MSVRCGLPLTPAFHCSAEMMGNVELAPEVDVNALEPLLSPNVVSELLDTYMSTLTVSRIGLQGQNVLWRLSVCNVVRHLS